jgi:hypothetical protein
MKKFTWLCLLVSSVAGSSIAMDKLSPPNQSFSNAKSCLITRLSSNGNRDRSYGKNTEWRTCNNNRLVFQKDGNLVLYTSSNSVSWATGTVGQAVEFRIQSDGNIALYNGSSEAIWATGTDKNPGASLVVQTDGNLVVYSKNSGGRALWSSGTYGGRFETRNASGEWLASRPPSTKPHRPLANMSVIPIPPDNKYDCRFDARCVGKYSTSKHTGVDYMVPYNTSVNAICDGVVMEAVTTDKPKNLLDPDSNVWSRFTIIKHENCGGYKELYSFYGHINPTVKKGDPVKKKEQIGNIAFYPNNNHLHFGLSTKEIFTNIPAGHGWGYDVRPLGGLGWIDPEVFAKKSGW